MSIRSFLPLAPTLDSSSVGASYFGNFSNPRYAGCMNSQASKILSHCPLCKKTYPEAAVRHLGEQNGANMYHCTCQACGHAMMAVVLEQAGLVSSIGIVTDLEINDALGFFQAKPVSNDECIEAHRVLEHHAPELCQALLNPVKKS